MQRLEKALGQLIDLLNDRSSGLPDLPKVSVKTLTDIRDALENYILGQMLGRSSKVDMFNFLLRKDPNRPFTFSVFHADGFRYASDAHLIAKLREDYPEEVERCLVDKTGRVHANLGDRTFGEGVPHYEAVIRETTKVAEKDLNWTPFDTEKMQNLTKKIQLATRTKQNTRFLVRVEDLDDGRTWYAYGDLFLKFYNLSKQIGAEGFSWSGSNQLGFFAKGEELVGVAPVLIDRLEAPETCDITDL